MLYFIFGPNTYLSKDKLKELIKQYSKDFELQEINGEKISLDEFRSKINSVSLLSPKRLLVIENLSTNKEQKDITDWLKTVNLSDNDVLIFFEEKIKKNTSLYKFLTRKDRSRPVQKTDSSRAVPTRATEVFEFNELNNIELKKWASDYIKKRNGPARNGSQAKRSDSGGKIEVVALEELMMNNNNLWLLSRELDKLLAYDKNITLKNVQLLTPSGFDDNIFNLTDAIGRGDKATALELINKQLDSGA